MGSRMVMALLLTLLAGFAAHARARVTLVEDGEPRATIVIAAKPSRNAREASEELQHYIEKMSGAKLQILSDDVKLKQPVAWSYVLVGPSALTDAIPGLTIPSGLTKQFREEGFVIQCASDHLVLAGNDAGFYLGTRYAVCDLLERLGVRWFLPGEFGQVVPKMSTITVNDMDVLERPDFAVRDYWTHGKGTMAAQREAWKIHNKLTPRGRGWSDWLGVPSDASVVRYLPKDQLEAHPDWFALRQDGTRDPQMPCMSSPEMIDHFVQVVKARAASGQKVTAFAPIDGYPRCYCKNCSGLMTGFDGYGANPRRPEPQASISNAWFHFVNSILRRVNEVYPEHLIATNGYANRDLPPELTDLNPNRNLVVMFANIPACTIHGYDDSGCWQMQRQGQMLRRWCELSDKVWIYNYNYTMLVGKDTLTPMVRRLGANIPRQKQWGMFGYLDQGEPDWSLTGITTHYVRTKLQWNAEVDVDAILADYFEKWFGPARAPMQAYYEALEAAFATARVHGHEDVILPEIYTPTLLKKLAAAMHQAADLAEDNPYKVRVHLERLMYDSIVHYMAMEQAKQQCAYQEAIEQLDRMIALRRQMHVISPFFGWRPYPVYDAAWEKRRMQNMVDKLSPPEGRLLTMLPAEAKFRTDLHDDGIYERWQAADLDDAKWRTLSATRGWQSQGLRDQRGFPYAGLAWYRFRLAVPDMHRRAPPTGSIHLYCPAVVNEAWVWVNGKYIGHKPYQEPWFRPSDFDLDISGPIQLGEQNQITIRVLCNSENFGANGIYERMLIYSRTAERSESQSE